MLMQLYQYNIHTIHIQSMKGTAVVYGLLIDELITSYGYVYIWDLYEVQIFVLA